jgi:CBS domain-containing protein
LSGERLQKCIRKVIKDFIQGDVNMDVSKFIISDIMSKDIINVSPDTTTKEAANVMLENGISSVAVKSDGKVLGIVTDKDFVKLLSSGKGLDNTKMSEIMSTKIIDVDPKITLQEASELTKKHDIRHLLIKAPGGYVGIVSVKDIIETLYEELKEQNFKLKDKIEELERFYRVAVGRELVMVKLKKRVKEMQKKLGSHGDLTEELFVE